jgi:hypothetical protein
MNFKNNKIYTSKQKKKKQKQKQKQKNTFISQNGSKANPIVYDLSEKFMFSRDLPHF